MATTVYKELLKSGKEFKHSDIGKIGVIVKNNFFSSYSGKRIKKIAQLEGEKIFNVFPYPDEFDRTIQKIIIEYFDSENLFESICETKKTQASKKETVVVFRKKRPRIKK